jgi:glycosyltransferase involved in cell wall biosynthesis
VIAAPLRIAINAQLHGDGRAGGIEPAVRGLVYALGRLDDDETQYTIVTHSSAPRWLDGELGRNQRVIVRSDSSPAAQPRLTPLRRALRPARATLRRMRHAARLLVGPAATARVGPTASDGFLESLGADLVHFPYQAMVMTSLPSVYQPWDLQHLHYPQFFTAEALAYRHATYPAYCRHATAVVTASRFTRQDVIERYRVDPQKVYTIPLSAATEVGTPIGSGEVAQVQQRHRIPDTFAYYPAQTWPHKNHIRLLEALALLRDRHRIVIPLVCTGALNDFWPKIERRCRQLRLADQVTFLGFLPAGAVRALYRLATFVVVPSLFEGWGFPLIEAFREGVAVASSSAAALREYAGDAALLFDPTSTESIADALGRIATDASLRSVLVQRGQKRADDFSWERAARCYRALYRRLAGRGASPEDELLLRSAL